MASSAEKLKAEKAKTYKVEHDVQRLHHLVAAASLMRDHTAVSALQAALVREVVAMNLKQLDLDAEEKAADDRAAQPSYNPDTEEKKSEEPTSRAPSVPRRS